ncbi:EAL domain-containing protein [Acinetobacter thermotolerans]|uniref:putative bifunctional diguanylate cyclase/phosphodiesterase n=1 Tax=Acinetobacter thermotolerans TaxID=3151487 RepID=UPI00325B5389
MEFDKQNLDAFTRFESPDSFYSNTSSSTPEELSLIQQFADALPHPVWVQTQNNEAYFNQAMTDYLGIDLNQHGSEKWQQFIHPDDLNNFTQEWHAALNVRQNIEIQSRIRKPDNSYRMCLLSMKFHHAVQSPLYWAISLTDIHDYFEIQQQLSQMITAQKNMLDASLDCIKIITPDGKLSHVNRSGRQALGLSENEHEFGMPWLDLLPPEVRASGKRALKRASQGLNARFSGKSQLDDQEPEYWDNLLTPMMDEHNVPQQILCVSRNISQQRQAETRLKAIMERDELTGLYNRRTFYKFFKRTLYKAQQQQGQVGLLLIDLDYFKHVNDTLGHIAGDHLLHVLGERFQKNLDPEAIVSRLGGDEFAVLVPNIQDESRLIDVAKQVCQQIEQPIKYTGRSINGGISVGGAIYPRDANNSSNLLKCADIALNDLKSSGRGGIRMFSQEMFESLDKMTRQLILARKIINSDQIVPYYQPKVRLSDGAVIGFEALLRWQDQKHQIQLPSHIFSAFQDYELASRISETMQLKVFEDMTRWQQQGLAILPISINAAPVEFLRDDYAEKLLERLSRFDIPADKVELEITEQSLSERGANYVIRALTLLKEAGINISLDDFGTGHSSLTRLQEYPVDCIKIDRNFVMRLNTDPSALAIVKAITQIGSSIKLDVLVEGIENNEQLSTLITCDCQIGQGFYFYRPMSGEAAQQLLQSESAA